MPRLTGTKAEIKTGLQWDQTCTMGLTDHTNTNHQNIEQ